MVMPWIGNPSGRGMLSRGAASGAALCRALAELGEVRLGEFPPPLDLTGSMPASPCCSPEAVGQAIFNLSELL